ncbi:MAG: hypothetical protein LAO22_04900 [Acidobacteriia bacterium]|nr:hypothetical protein [Terriglobia bacterium]
MATPAYLTVRRRDRVFYLGMALTAAAVVFAGFARTFYLRNLFGHPPLRLLLALHGVLFTLWIVLFFIQPALVAVKRTDLHRRLGVAGGVIAALMTLIVPITAIEVSKPGFRPGAPSPLSFLSVPMINILVFAILVAAGLYYRRKSDTHKRLMLLATISILPAAMARLPFAFIRANGALAFFGLADVVLLLCIAYDGVVHRRLHPAFACGGLLFIASQPLCVALGHTAAWLAFAQWLTR